MNLRSRLKTSLRAFGAREYSYYYYYFNIASIALAEQESKVYHSLPLTAYLSRLDTSLCQGSQLGPTLFFLYLLYLISGHSLYTLYSSSPGFGRTTVNSNTTNEGARFYYKLFIE